MMGGFFMRNFKDVIGQKQIIEHFQHVIQSDKISHAYILNGEEGTGKKMLADIFSAVLQCEEKGIEPCGKCLSCRQAEGKNQPDIIWVTHEKPNSIGVEDVRGQIIGDIQTKPYKGPYKIYIIAEAQKLTPQAQNALLKTIEEPPAYGIILFLTTNSQSFLPTILSRCVTLNLKPVSDAEIRKYLMEKVKIPDYKADLCVAFAQGNLGKAIKLASSEHFDEIKQHAVSLLRRAGEIELSELLRNLKEINEFKIDINDYLDLMLIWFRDVLLFKVTNDANVLVMKEELSSITKQAVKSSYEGLEEIITAIDKVKVRLKANVTFELTIELMLLTIKENLR